MVNMFSIWTIVFPSNAQATQGLAYDLGAEAYFDFLKEYRGFPLGPGKLSLPEFELSDRDKAVQLLLQASLNLIDETVPPQSYVLIGLEARRYVKRAFDYFCNVAFARSMSSTNPALLSKINLNERVLFPIGFDFDEYVIADRFFNFKSEMFPRCSIEGDLGQKELIRKNLVDCSAEIPSKDLLVLGAYHVEGITYAAFSFVVNGSGHHYKTHVTPFIMPFLPGFHRSGFRAPEQLPITMLTNNGYVFSADYLTDETNFEEVD